MSKEYRSINVLDIVVLKTLTLVVPLLAGLVEAQIKGSAVSLVLIGKWFLVSAVGIRLVFSGIRYISWWVLCIGIVALLSVLSPLLQVTATVIALVYFLFMILQQARKSPLSVNEWIELLTDSVVVLSLTGYLLLTYQA